MISKELLSEVLEHRVLEIKSVEDNYIKYYHNQNHKEHFAHIEVNTYEIAHKCKEKAREYGFSITTGNRVDGTDRYDVLCIHKDEDIECGEAVFFNEIVDTEPNGIFMAMQWILDNKEENK